MFIQMIKYKNGKVLLWSVFTRQAHWQYTIHWFDDAEIISWDFKGNTNCHTISTASPKKIVHIGHLFSSLFTCFSFFLYISISEISYFRADLMCTIVCCVVCEWTEFQFDIPLKMTHAQCAHLSLGNSMSNQPYVKLLSKMIY